MLAAVLLINETGSYVGRPLTELSKEKITEAVETFIYERKKNKNTSIIESKIGTFFYQEIDDLSVVVLAEKEDQKITEALKILETVSKSTVKTLTLDGSEDLFTLLLIIDELFVREGVILRTVEEISKALSLYSNDEILHEMIIKNKEKEKEKTERLKKIHPAIDELTKEIEEIKILREDLRKDKKQERAKVQQEPRKSKGIIEGMSSKVNLVTHLKQTATVNSTTEITKVEGVGEFLIRITDAECEDTTVILKNKPKLARAHPSVDKKGFSSNEIRPKTELPINTTLTLMKWTLEDSVLPVEISFWQTEVSEERYKFFIEVTAVLTDIQYISIRVPIKRVSDIDITTGYVKGDNIISEIEDLKRDESKSVEFSGLCDDTDSLFPFTVFYTVEEKESVLPIEISQVLCAGEEIKNISLARVIEGECTVVNS